VPDGATSTAEEPDAIIADLGRQIRLIRRRRGLTLEEASEAAGITAGYLSQIERGLAVPALLSLKRIADSLNVRLADLFEDEELSSPYGLVRRDQRPRYRHPMTGRLHEYLTPTWGGRIAAALYSLEPGEETEHLFHSGEEFAYLLNGQLAYHVGTRCFRMEPGDSLYFDASENHYVVNIGTVRADWLWLATTIP
jgi:transcriptional regulator with XRE-family HTH domain